MIAITRNVNVPLSADDPDMENGWQSIPIPPTNNPAWIPIEDRDRKTVWWGPDSLGKISTGADLD
jgi:hypothetical protein